MSVSVSERRYNPHFWQAASTFPMNKAAATKPSPGSKLHVDARSEPDMFVIEAGSSPVANSETYFANLRNEANQPKANSRPSPSITDVINTFEIEIQEYYSASKGTRMWRKEYLQV